MLKVIAQDFIKPEHIEDVMPLYREFVEKTKKRTAVCILRSSHQPERPGALRVHRGVA